MDIPYTLIRSKRKTIALIVQRDGTLLVRAPLRLARRAVEEFISQKAAWIQARQAIARSAPPRQFSSGEQFTFLGKAYPLEIVSASGSAVRQSALIPAARPARTALSQLNLPFWPAPAAARPAAPTARRASSRHPSLELAGGRFRLAQQAQARAAAVFTAWYMQQAHRVIEERVTWFATRFDLKYGKVHISSARTRWGSCSSRGTLSFTWRLVMAPLDVIDYVVAHELAHLRIKNHSPAFWREVESILPDYKARRKWLKTNGSTLEL